MKVKITIPEDISDITLEQYQKYSKLLEREDLGDFDKSKRIIEVFTELSYHQINDISQKDYAGIILQISKALNTDCDFKDRFTLNEVEYGFIPNLDKITTAEFVDLSEYGNDNENMNKVMAVLFRPVTKTDKFDNYKIKEYNGTESTKEVMKKMPMHIVNGAMGFFSSLGNELRMHILKSTQEAREKGKEHPTISRSGVGTVPSMN